MKEIQLSERQEKIITIVKEQGPIKGEEIADILGYVRATLRPDLAVLTRSGFLEARPRVGYYFTGKGTNFQLQETVNKLKVNDWKAIPAVVSENATAYDAIVTLFMMDTGSLFVVKAGGLLEGVVSRKDLLKVALGQADIHKVPITVIMTRMPNVVTVKPEDTLMLAARKLMNHEIDSLPVVRRVCQDGKEGLEVIGRITKTTITRAFAELGAELPLISKEGGEDNR